MNKRFLFIEILVGCILGVITCIPCFASSEMKFRFLTDRTITTETTNFDIVYDNSGAAINPDWKGASLYITTKSGQILFKQKCKKGYMSVNIKPQKSGTVLRIYIKSPDGISNKKTVTVKKLKRIIPEKISSKLKPVKVTSKYGRYKVTAKKGQTVIIRNKKRILQKIKFDKKRTEKTIDIAAALEKGELYLYTVKGNRRCSKYTVIPRTIEICE